METIIVIENPRDLMHPIRFTNKTDDHDWDIAVSFIFFYMEYCKVLKVFLIEKNIAQDVKLL